MFAPRLLVSPDLVHRAVLVGLAPARSARPSVPSRPWRPLQSGPTDGITQRDICWIAQLDGSGPGPQVYARYIGGTCEVHPVADTRVPHRSAQLGTVLLLALRPGRRCVCPCAITGGRMSAGRFSPRARRASGVAGSRCGWHGRARGALGFSWFPGRGIGASGARVSGERHFLALRRGQ